MRPLTHATLVTEQITPLLITYNEEDNIGRVLAKLDWARRIVVVDSGSTDGTLSILSKHPHVEVHARAFDTFAAQCNYGLSLIATPWTLSLDADYVLSDELVAELHGIRFDGPVSGYSARFDYVVHGKPLRGALYPPRVVLYRTEAATYHDEGHGHRVQVNGLVRSLRGVILHDDRKPLSRWFASQQRYARREADFLLSAPRASLRMPDRLRLLIWPAPFAVFFYTLLVKGCIFDGWRGWHYALQRLIAECMLAIELTDQRLAAGSVSKEG